MQVCGRGWCVCVCVCVCGDGGEMIVIEHSSASL